MKTCFKCGLVKPINRFYKHSKMADGHLGKCIDCAKEDVEIRAQEKQKDPLWMKKERNRCRIKQDKYRALGVARKTKNETHYAWRNRNKHKARAHRLAERKHKIAPEKCERCKLSKEKLYRHHPDYSKPLEINWLCSACHGIVHRKDQEI